MAAVGHCLGHLALDRVYAGIDVANIDSLNLFIKCGFGIDRFLPGVRNSNGDIQGSYIVSIANEIRK